MKQPRMEQWPHYTYIVPHVYTRAKVRLIGFGNYVPSGRITNEFFSYVTTRLGEPRSPQEIEHATGLRTRHVRNSTLVLCQKIAGKDAPGLIFGPRRPEEESLAEMALAAAKKALASAGRDPVEVDTIIGASSSDNDAFPTFPSIVQTRLGMRSVRSTMLKGGCACQTESLQACAEVLSASSARLALLVMAEGLLSNVMHILDWRLSSLFGEGAAAFLLERRDDDEDGDNEAMYIINGADAHQAPALHGWTPLRKDVIAMAEEDRLIQRLYEEGKGAELQRLFVTRSMPGYAKMNGREVFREAPRAMAEAVDALLRHAGLDYDNLDYIIPHQANSRIIHRMGDLLIRDYGWPSSTMEKLVDNFRDYGNLSNASIGTSLVELMQQGKLREGQWLALPAVGAGLNYGSCLLRFHFPENPATIVAV
ncbi:MAG TPA: 3-oxoacyl-[acyl-carrier-protein] synthase III C-terminal domain-containing protein [Ktedonobacteraceae bacterium]|nr:3-oxoacyl-[acyl-carrier-protein] synthase III C-terminal domain-containing protein [Ktedonobacteraceae bacterium]